MIFASCVTIALVGGAAKRHPFHSERNGVRSAKQREQPCAMPNQRTAWTLILVVGLFTDVSPQESPSVQRGRAFALANCARCHSVDKVTQSSLPLAPPFRTLHLRYPVESLEEALGEGISVGYIMPEFRLTPTKSATSLIS